MKPEDDNPLELLKKSWCTHDAVTFWEVLERHPDLQRRINEPVAAFDSPLITTVRGGFGLLHGASPELAAYAIECGAVIDVHAAARLGLLDRLRELISAQPRLVNAPGGDGQTPLHFASNTAVAECLLDRGAEIDALDVDHESTAAQYMVRDRQEVLRYLIQRGCKTDVLMAAAIGLWGSTFRPTKSPNNSAMRMFLNY